MRNILADKPRVTKWSVNFDSANLLDASAQMGGAGQPVETEGFASMGVATEMEMS